jgi:hypothetical protein
MKHMKKTLALSIFAILALQLISIPSAKADFTISFNTSCTTAGTNCNDITLAIGDSGASTPFRSFDGDAEGTGWLMTGTFPSWNSAAIQPNGTLGGFIMTIEGGTVSSQPLSLQFKTEDADVFTLIDFASCFKPCANPIGSIDYDPWIVPITHSSNASPPKFTLDYLAFARIQNPSQISNITGNFTLSVEHRVRFLDGISGISGGDQTIAFSNFTFTNSNKGNSVLRSEITDTTTLTTSTKEFIRLNAVFYDRVIAYFGASGHSISMTSGNYPRIEFQTFYDDVNFQNGWTKADILNLTSCAGTFTDPCTSGQTDLLQDFNPRSWWFFDFPQNFPNSDVNPDGYEGWTWSKLLGGSGNHTTGAASCGGGLCKATWTITRTTAIADDSASVGFTPKSIQYKIFTWSTNQDGFGEWSCGVGSVPVQDQLISDSSIMSERLFIVEGESLKFIVNHHLLVTRNNIGDSTTCNFNAQLFYRILDTDGILLTTGVINDKHYTGLIKGGTITDPTDGFKLEVFLPSSASQNFQFLTLQIGFIPYNFTQSGQCNANCTVSYNMFLDTYSSNWMPFKDSNGDICDAGEECTPEPTPTCNELGYTTDPVVARSTGKCLIPLQDTFCELFPTDSACTGITPPTVQPDITIGGDPTTGLGGIPVDCGSGTLDFTPIDFTNTQLATNSVTNLLTNIGILMGCAPTLWIPLITLLGGIGGIAAFVSKDVAIHGIFAFIIVWSFFFAVVGFIPFWMALLTAMGIVGIWVLIGKRTITTTAE